MVRRVMPTRERGSPHSKGNCLCYAGGPVVAAIAVGTLLLIAFSSTRNRDERGQKDADQDEGFETHHTGVLYFKRCSQYSGSPDACMRTRKEVCVPGPDSDQPWQCAAYTAAPAGTSVFSNLRHKCFGTLPMTACIINACLHAHAAWPRLLTRLWQMVLTLPGNFAKL